MTEPPRRGRLTDAQMLRQMLGGRGQLLGGQSRAPLAVPKNVPTPSGIDLIAIVKHGDDGNATRPVAVLVYWVGAATPVNGEPFDFWYTANI